MSATVFFADSGGNELATLTNTFKVSGTPTDPTAVSCVVTDPTGTATTHTYNGASPADITRTGTGAYALLIGCIAAGVWTYEWIGTGTASDVVSGTWTVNPLASAQYYCTPEELKSRLGIGDATDDFEVTTAVQAACKSIDEICGRYFWRGTDTRTYVPQSLFAQELDDIVSVTTFKVDFDGDGVYEQTWTQGTDYALTVAPGQYNAASRGEQWPYTGFQVITAGKNIPFTWPWSHQDRIQVTGVFGWPAVPAAVKQAAMIAAADIFKLKDAPFGIMGSPDLGVIRVGQNSRVMTLLRRYISGSTVGV